MTIGIPVYQVEAYIARSLESALSQTFSSIEFLIVDDCGGDRSMDIVRKIQKSHLRGKDIRVLSNDRNLGVSASRNRIIDEARGDYLYFMDADDEIAEDTISMLILKIKTYDAEIAFGSYQKKETSGNVEIFRYPDAQFLDDNQLAFFSYRKFGGIQASACNYLVKLSILREHQLRFIDTNFWEDLAFTFELVTYIRRAVLISDITYFYLCREHSLSNYQKRVSIGKDEILRNIRVIDYLKKNSLRVVSQPYFPKRCYCLMQADIYVVCYILKRRQQIIPSISNKEIQRMMAFPATWHQVLGFQELRLVCIFFLLLGKIPSSWCVWTVRCIGKLKKLL